MEELIIQNEWWETGTILTEKAKPYRRKIFREIAQTYSKYKQILILTGLRRVGKSTIIYQIIEELLKKGTKPGHIIYFSFDKAVREPLEILAAYEKITKVDWKREKIYLFLDEVQKLADWSAKIKLLYDSLPNIKICLSGSASLTIEKNAIKDLAGRYFAIDIKLLTLQEFAELYYGKTIDSFELWQTRIEALFDDYIKKPFPELVQWQDKEKINTYLKELVVERITKIDVPEIFKKVNTNLLARLTELFMKDIGCILNIESLSRDLHVHKLTLADHIYYLKFGKLIRIVKNYRPSIRAESRKLAKIYPAHPCLAFSFYAEPEKGLVAENLVAAALDLDRYFRLGSHEIDFLKIDKGILPIEVKAKAELSHEELKPLLWFLHKYKLRRAAVVYFGKKRQERLNNAIVKFIPLSKLLFRFEI